MSRHTSLLGTGHRNLIRLIFSNTAGDNKPVELAAETKDAACLLDAKQSWEAGKPFEPEGVQIDHRILAQINAL